MTGSILHSFRDDPVMRSAFFAFVKEVFPGLDFEEWHRRGFWDDRYRPFCLMDGKRMVSNVSITEMALLMGGREIRGYQFATVGTVPDFRGKGLSRKLMEFVLERFRNQADLFFLFANERVQDFYPRFGFRSVQEYRFRREVPELRPAFAARSLDLSASADCDLIAGLLTSRLPLSGLFGASDHAFITWWHLLNVFPKNLLYLEKEKVMIIAIESKGCLSIFDIITEDSLDLPKILPRIVRDEDTRTVECFFPPDEWGLKGARAIPDNDSPLFVLGEFPLAGHPFKFPTTAQT